MNFLSSFLLISHLTTVKMIILHETPADRCEFNATILPKQRFNFNNENYPDTYDMGVNCRWTFNCLEGYACRLRCSDVGLPATLGCYLDRLLVSTIADSKGARVFCGRDTINVRSHGTKITLKLITSRLSPGGRFRCSVKSEKWKRPRNYATMEPLSMKLTHIRKHLKKDVVEDPPEEIEMY